MQNFLVYIHFILSSYLDGLRKRKEVVFESDPLVYSQSTVSRTVELQLAGPNRSANANHTVISSKVWVPIHTNRSNVFLHVLLVDEDSLGRWVRVRCLVCTVCV